MTLVTSELSLRFTVILSKHLCVPHRCNKILSAQLFTLKKKCSRIGNKEVICPKSYHHDCNTFNTEDTL